uniref:Transcription initiation factor IIF subunit alpha n=1 Tax=Ascaris lumbricoides TaxID=6252 RepID=A0A9J2P4U5_ASCLU
MLRRYGVLTVSRLVACTSSDLYCCPGGSRALHFSLLRAVDGKKSKDDEPKINLDEIDEALKKESAGGKGFDEKFMNFKQKREQAAHDRSHIFSWKAAVGTLAVGGVALAALLYMREKRTAENEKRRKLMAGKARIGGPWELLNTDGKLEGSEQLKGNWLLIYFGFTHCPDICPDEIEKMIKVMTKSRRGEWEGGDGGEGSLECRIDRVVQLNITLQVVDILDADPQKKFSIIPVFISVDPERDTIERVKEYCLEFSPKLRGYTGSREQVDKVAKTFRVYYSQGPRSKNAPDDYIVDHSVIMYLVDPDGNFHDYYGQNRNENEIANVIKLKVIKHEVPLIVFSTSERSSFCGIDSSAAAFAPGCSGLVWQTSRPNRHKRYSILKFSKSLMVDPGRWTTQDSVHMSREDNRAQAAATEIKQDYGAGTEYGSAAREEARRKKYGHQTRRYQVDSQPWRLTVEDQREVAGGKERKFRSIREGGAGEHADYWIFMKSGGEFHAHKVDDWYQFLPCIQHPVLDIDQAEERFQQRNQVMNQFALKAQIRRQLNAMNEDGEQIVKTTKMLKIKDEASSDEDESEGEKGDGEDSRGLKKAQKKKNRQPRKDKKQRVENADEVAAYESEDGEDEGREYDYMSDSGSDTE